MKSSQIPQLEKDVFIGKEEKFPTRLIFVLLPDEVRAERIRKHNKENKKKGRQTTEQYLARAGMNLFITNVKKDVFQIETIMLVYRLRWQIELVFKIWKSTFGIDVIHKMKVERFKCMLYCKLLFIFLSWEVVTFFRQSFYDSAGKWLSLDKCFKTLKRYALELRQYLIKSVEKVENLIHKIYSSFVSGHWLEVKKNHVGFKKILSLKL
jgi:hypothetical protein